MHSNNIISYINQLLPNIPQDWINLTTHRLDIYNEALAKSQFLEEFELLVHKNNYQTSDLHNLPTAYDYIRLGHPLSSVLEWTVAQMNSLKAENIISFSSSTMPILAILRKQLIDGNTTHIFYTSKLPEQFQVDIIQQVYGYKFELKQIENASDIPSTNGKSIFISYEHDLTNLELNDQIDFVIRIDENLGSVLAIHPNLDSSFISDIQHVRRRETIAMTPHNCLIALQRMLGIEHESKSEIVFNAKQNAQKANQTVKEITQSKVDALFASSGLSMQYAIMMGILDFAQQHYSDKPIKIVVPTNCYGGTNDQARRVAAIHKYVEIVDLAVDGEQDMVQNIDILLTKIALEDAVPFIIAEIPTNPRVEVPDLHKLEAALSKQRHTATGQIAIDPVFVLDQTFCPNVHFLREEDILSTVRTISYVSGSKFPSGGKCTAGYCVTNQAAEPIMKHIGLHLSICDNQATPFQLDVLAQQLPSMVSRIQKAFVNTEKFVQFIQEVLPEAKINFVSKEVIDQGFTPSVFSLDLPTKGNTEAEKEAYKRELNLKLINLMISNIPNESKYCVSYGQLSGCYWTIPATSTQGTTKEGDKDYIIRASLSPNLDLEKHQAVFQEFVRSL